VINMIKWHVLIPLAYILIINSLFVRIAYDH
jgi:hypothetical protein